MRIVAALCLLLSLVACAVEEGASMNKIAVARHFSDEPPYISVVSMVDRSDQRAAHTALIINASERVIYDPAGTFDHADMPERGDIHYGATDRMVSYYKRYHARFSHFVHEQRMYVPPAIAETALRRAQAQGPSMKMFCTTDTIAILRDVPGYEGLSQSFLPETLRRQIAAFPNVTDGYTFEDDASKTVPVN